MSGLQCVSWPGQPSPTVPATKASSPPALWWIIAFSISPTELLQRLLLQAKLPNSNVVHVSIFTCRLGQVQVDPCLGTPIIGVLFCCDVPCTPGYSWVPGYCLPCQLGSYKSTVGFYPFIQRPTCTYTPFPAVSQS